MRVDVEASILNDFLMLPSRYSGTTIERSKVMKRTAWCGLPIWLATWILERQEKFRNIGE